LRLPPAHREGRNLATICHQCPPLCDSLPPVGRGDRAKPGGWEPHARNDLMRTALPRDKHKGRSVGPSPAHHASRGPPAPPGHQGAGEAHREPRALPRSGNQCHQCLPLCDSLPPVGRGDRAKPGGWEPHVRNGVMRTALLRDKHEGRSVGTSAAHRSRSPDPPGSLQETGPSALP
jgi:hypothetical protein